MSYPDGRRRDDLIEHKPKRVILADHFGDRVGALADARIAERFNLFTDCIVHGRVVPRQFYRRGLDAYPDGLLTQEGIKHVHLDGGGGDALLFLVEYDDAVVYLEINSHKHFADDPPGSVLRSLHANCLRREDKSAVQRVTARLAEKMRIVRGGLKPRRSRGPARGESDPRAKGR